MSTSVFLFHIIFTVTIIYLHNSFEESKDTSFRQALQFSSIMQQIKQYVHITISFMRKLMSWNANATVDDDSTVHITKREAVKWEAMSNQKINWLYDNVSTYADICILGSCMHIYMGICAYFMHKVIQSLSATYCMVSACILYW